MTAWRSGRKPPWRVLYESAEITITSWYVEVDGVRVAVSELRDMTRCFTHRYPLARGAAVTAGLELLIATPFAAIHGSAMMLCAGFVSAGGMVLGLWGDHRRNPRWQQIEATVRGRRVVVFAGHDHREFGCVWRALVRAVEDNRQLLPDLKDRCGSA